MSLAQCVFKILEILKIICAFLPSTCLLNRRSSKLDDAFFMLTKRPWTWIRHTTGDQPKIGGVVYPAPPPRKNRHWLRLFLSFDHRAKLSFQATRRKAWSRQEQRKRKRDSEKERPVALQKGRDQAEKSLPHPGAHERLGEVSTVPRPLLCRQVVYLVKNSSAASPKFCGGGKMFDFKRITPFCLSKHKMTTYAENLRGAWSPRLPLCRRWSSTGYAYGQEYPLTTAMVLLRQRWRGRNFMSSHQYFF